MAIGVYPHNEAPAGQDVIYRDRVRTWHRFTEFMKASVIGTAVVLILLAWVTL